MSQLLIVDDEQEVRNFFAYLLRNKPIHLTVASNAAEANRLIQAGTYDAALLDLKLPDGTGLDILRLLKKTHPACRVVLMTGYSTVKSALEAIRLGADDYIEKPFSDIDELERLIDSLLVPQPLGGHDDRLRIAKESGLVIGTSHAMSELVSLAWKIARKNVTVLIEGETGCGKEVLARFLHLASMRRDEPFIEVNCGALTETLLESELFGHEKGSFTGALSLKRGLFEVASRGTLFLDEIGDATPAIQVKLLRVLETKSFLRVGGEHTLRTDARIIAASHVNLPHAVATGTFREDLLYRLDVVKLSIPPLRERRADIPLLARHLLDQNDGKNFSFSADALTLMQAYDWPGNIRELANVVKRALALADGDTFVLTSEYLPQALLPVAEAAATRSDRSLSLPTVSSPVPQLERELDTWKQMILTAWNQDGTVSLPEVLTHVKELERIVGEAFVKKALRETLGNRKKASEQLNISVRTLRYLLHEK
ncbi:sigma-54-dependent transcriptional regulator [Aneurinibacillus uraniidurans]|uniref:sigma-54-dependent transcriptional regulator n=1 Tax=Aneurinibacillus uraniidurans TaxID=2966586 RepID=UPI002349CC01|nr:sigma-54 dependent transcriptional regulator [Aneurinibacillus sp. B1]WCN39370.1 sigma-54 dependent transcriptional regulator [Aneurinibacillus sp. B1]